MAKDKILKNEINKKKYIKNKSVIVDRNVTAFLIIAYVFFIYGSLSFMDLIGSKVNAEGNIAKIYVALASIFVYLLTIFLSWLIIMIIFNYIKAFEYKEIK